MSTMRSSTRAKLHDLRTHCERCLHLREPVIQVVLDVDSDLFEIAPSQRHRTNPSP